MMGTRPSRHDPLIVAGIRPNPMGSTAERDQTNKGTRNLPLSREMAIKRSNLQQPKLVQILADPKSMQNGSLHYFFSYLTDFDVVMRKLISE
jgi:hypothetical protein